MKKLELNDLGVQELNSVEMTKVEGGGFLTNFLSALLSSVTTTATTVATDTLQYAGKQVNNVLSLIGSL